MSLFTSINSSLIGQPNNSVERVIVISYDIYELMYAFVIWWSLISLSTAITIIIIIMIIEIIIYFFKCYISESN